jgi:HEAT repeat protein
MEETGSESIEALINSLASQNRVERERALKLLAARGESALPALVRALNAPDAHLRWEVTKGLRQIAHSASTPALVGALEDASSGVRWCVAEGLIAMGRQALRPLLRALMERPESMQLRRGARHVLHDLQEAGCLGDLTDEMTEVTEAMREPDSVSAIRVAASAALNVLVRRDLGRRGESSCGTT